ncbi:flavodoxin family protein [Acidaminobacter sp. JC074]|uniref:flavodoxin family protein n=1 Tax=Acidaminobacter sp. JC074 TaxID=2530199 RepID=UPI001F114F2E|nr:flavodoxin family protein [Acidaminobacter sp. JC074]MCH4890001.1 flavodoxin family protein [Acidaminobacter sp. JC074]
MIQIITDTHLDTDYPVFLADNNYKTCTGCLSCWLRTPGKCILGGDINSAIIASDHLIIVTHANFGSYSSPVKRVIDRTIPLVLPTFKTINGDLHHQARYKKYPSIHVICYDVTLEEEKVLMNKMVLAHSINLHAPMHALHYCKNKDLKAYLDKVIGGLNE